jgi:hypothetical protein
MYSEAQLDAFQPKLEADAASLPANNKRARVLLTLHAKMGNMPASFTGVSEKERRLLDHVENFRKQVRGCQSSTVRKRGGVCESFESSPRVLLSFCGVLWGSSGAAAVAGERMVQQ